MQSDRYRSLRRDLIELLEDHPNPTTLIETSYVATKLHEFGVEMDAIASEAIAIMHLLHGHRVR